MFHLTVPFLTAHWPAVFALAALALATRPKGNDSAPIRVHSDTIHRRAP